MPAVWESVWKVTVSQWLDWQFDRNPENKRKQTSWGPSGGWDGLSNHWGTRIVLPRNSYHIHYRRTCPRDRSEASKLMTRCDGRISNTSKLFKAHIFLDTEHGFLICHTFLSNILSYEQVMAPYFGWKCCTHSFSLLYLGDQVQLSLYHLGRGNLYHIQQPRANTKKKMI